MINIRRLSIRRTLFCLFLAWLFIFPVHAQETLERKIAQMVMVGFSPYSQFRDTLHYDIEHRNLGGAPLFASDLENPSADHGDERGTAGHGGYEAAYRHGPGRGFCREAGREQRFFRTPTAYHLGTVVDSEDSTRRYAGMMADWLSSTGINTNLAPVADVNVNPSSPAIGYFERSFSSDPDKVTDHVSWFASESAERGVMTALKHFPGHGSAEQDSHLGFTDITETWSEAELVPYRELISDGYSGMVMAGHLYNAGIDSVYPASLSEKR
ncbi:MAG: glycoside hydrolase family 3 N-terminal domain-containing protein [Candidatus Marinimicrobia bacterium]|nr:glycoside hydrolase family 3 N-terminal domain-containing protein [Candidatus Neomarinimicrobiota bacterium]